MKKIKFLTTPMRVTDISFDDIDDSNDESTLKVERIDTRKWRKFKHEMA